MNILFRLWPIAVPIWNPPPFALNAQTIVPTEGLESVFYNIRKVIKI